VAGLPEFLWETQLPKRKRDPNAPKLKRQRYTKEIKEEVCNAMMQAGANILDLSSQFNVPAGTLRGWRDEYNIKPLPTTVAGLGEESASLFANELEMGTTLGVESGPTTHTQEGLEVPAPMVRHITHILLLSGFCF
jgi:hypothetical protein